MTCTYPTPLGLLTLLALTGCSGDAVDSLEYPSQCYEACSACCNERHAETRDFCLLACGDSPVNPMGYPDCAVPPEECPRLQ
jgi:hypothetical protein